MAGRKKIFRQKRIKKSQKIILNIRPKFLYLSGLGLILVLGLLMINLINFKTFQTPAPKFSVSPVAHFIASLSAQKRPIIIDPEFSYQEEVKKNNPPERIIIPSLNIDLPVVEAKIVDGFWETATQSASFGLGSASPGQNGNTVIFAHALPGLFDNLGSIQKEQLIYLLTKNQWFVYQVKEVKTVLPTAIEVISPTADKTLTLYTCSGFKDAYRFVVIAKALED